ncbi:MAG: 16S rRNA (cytidine(1402)-2'-O)-methyltransferase [Hyphomicrobiales bacterium]|nr:16S rRNA (cytidine(1402)-2'-O)-methyltransferase [Hyphomicrobiales bacterium]
MTPQTLSTFRRYSIGAGQFEAEKLPGGLYVTATPIGHLGDVTLRALATMAAADILLCEDTRTTAKLLERYGIRTRLMAYHEHNAAKVRPAILRSLSEGQAIALVSDAGMPLVSDPGYRLVADCVAHAIPVTAIPGASAVLTALALSGLPTDRFTFLGFLPTKSGERKKLLNEFMGVKASLIAFESPHRIVDALGDVADVLGNRRVAVSRELTKLHEEVLRGTASEVQEILGARASVKGEIALVIAPPEPGAAQASDADIDSAIDAALESKPAAKAAADIAKRFDLAKKDIYARILARKNE